MIWNVNPDNNSVSAINGDNYSLTYETSVGEKPQSIAITKNGKLWVVNKGNATISIIEGTTGSVINTKSLAHGSSPVSVLIDTENNVAYVSLENSKQIVKINTNNYNIINTLEIGLWPSNMALDAVRKRLWVSKFISPDDAGKLTVIVTNQFSN